MEKPRELAELTLNQDAIQAPMRVILVAPTLHGGKPMLGNQPGCAASVIPVPADGYGQPGVRFLKTPQLASQALASALSKKARASGVPAVGVQVILERRRTC